MPDTQGIRLLLVDDHLMFTAALSALLEKEPDMVVAAQARTRDEALQAVRDPFDIILLDLTLGAECSLDFLPDLMEGAEDARIIVLTGAPDPQLHLRAACLGAMGVVLKGEPPERLIKAIRKVHAGEVWMNRTMMASAMVRLQARHPKEDANAARIASLTPRELEVIASLGEGRRNKEIAERLFISEKTVRHYLTSIFNKLEVAGRLELMIFAYQHGLTKVPAKHAPLVAAVNE